MTKYGLGLEMGDNIRVAWEERYRFAPAVTFSAITACWVSKLSFFITLIRLVSRRWQRVMLWFLMTTSTASLIVLSEMQAFSECGSVVAELVEPSKLHHEHKGCAHPRITRRFSMYASIYATAMVSFLAKGSIFQHRSWSIIYS